MNYIYDCVQKLIKKHNTNDPFILCDYLNITVIAIPLSPEIYGFYTSSYDIQFLFINKLLNEIYKN